MSNPLDKLKSVCDGATEGPWSDSYIYEAPFGYDLGKAYATGPKHQDNPRKDYVRNSQKDAKFIATARTALPLLIEVIEKQREALEKNLKHSTLFLGGNTGSQMMAAYVQDYSMQALTETAKMLARIGE